MPLPLNRAYLHSETRQTMNRSFLALTCCLVFTASCSTGLTKNIEHRETHIMTPEDFMQAYETALATQDWNEVAPLMHEDVCVTFSSGTHKGIDEVRKAFERNFSLIESEHYEISDVHWVMSGDHTAVCLYTFRWRGIINGVSSGGEGRGTWALVRTPEGWKLLTEHLGPLPS